jgi:hypothetical protein
MICRPFNEVNDFPVKTLTLRVIGSIYPTRMA